MSIFDKIPQVQDKLKPKSLFDNIANSPVKKSTVPMIISDQEIDAIGEQVTKNVG